MSSRKRSITKIGISNSSLSKRTKTSHTSLICNTQQTRNHSSIRLQNFQNSSIHESQNTLAKRDIEKNVQVESNKTTEKFIKPSKKIYNQNENSKMGTPISTEYSTKVSSQPTSFTQHLQSPKETPPSSPSVYSDESVESDTDFLESVNIDGEILEDFDIEIEAISKEEVDPELSSEKFNHTNVIPLAGGLDDLEEFYGLPPICQKLFKEFKGVSQLYDWQKEVLGLKELQNGKNLIYSLPTSGGKTLIAEIIMLRTVLVLKKKALFILPYVSLVEEKKESMELFGDNLNFQVEAYYANQGIIPIPSGNVLCVATIEKANSIINSLIEEGKLHELGCVVVDELHMIGEGNERGSLLESVLTKILYSCKYNKNVNVQIVGMSATIPNISQLAEWLDAHLYVSSFRPVPLTEYIVYDNKVFDNKNNLVRVLPEPPKRDEQNVALLCTEVIPDHSVLIFCSCKRNCEYTASHLASLFPESFKERHKKQKIQLLRDLESCNSSNTVDDTLRKTIPFGIAYHHSGLTSEERILIEQAFRNHVLCVLTATSTLAAGVNLPARRVIFRQPYIGLNEFLEKSRYMQMSGRAGRAGIDAYGESFLLLTNRNNEYAKGLELVTKPLENVCSKLSKVGIQRLVLELICSGITRDIEDIKNFAKLTFFHYSKKDEQTSIQEEFINAINFLLEHKFLTKNENDVLSEDSSQQSFNSQISNVSNNSQSSALSENTENVEEEEPKKPKMYITTPFGEATFKSAFSMEEAAFVSKQLARCQEQGLILSDELHLCYLVTPIGIQDEPNWSVLFSIYNSLSQSRQRITTLIGLSENLIVTRAMNNGRRSANEDTDKEALMIAKRFYFALVLCDLVNEKTIWEVSHKYKVNRGSIQRIMISASLFASMMVNFCKRMGWTFLECILERYSKRLGFGAKSDILELVEIEGVGPIRARALLNMGLHDVKSVAKANPNRIAKKLRKKLGYNPKKTAERIVENAKKLLRKKANAMRFEMEDLESYLE